MLAAKLGVGKSHISRVLHGKRQSKRVEAAARKMGCAPSPPRRLPANPPTKPRRTDHESEKPRRSSARGLESPLAQFSFGHTTSDLLAVRLVVIGCHAVYKMVDYSFFREMPGDGTICEYAERRQGQPTKAFLFFGGPP